MTLPFYASPEQLTRDRSDFARRGIARGRSVVVLRYADGVVFVAENPSTTLRKVSEIYDRIGFAAAGKYNEFENMRRAGIQLADMRGYAYDRKDVTGSSLANAYAQTLGNIFIEQQKPFEVELCVAEVGDTPDSDQLFRLTYDGSIFDEPDLMVMGGETEDLTTRLRAAFHEELQLGEAIRIAVHALGATRATTSNGGEQPGGHAGGQQSGLTTNQLEVAVLDRNFPRRAFRRIQGPRLTEYLDANAHLGDASSTTVETPDSSSPSNNGD